MISVKILDETAPLEAVILGTAKSFGGVPALEETYDPKSREHLKAAIYPTEEELVHEMEQVFHVLEKYGVKVYRPNVMDNYNQVFSRDIALVIDDQLIVPHIIPLRKKETEGIKYVTDQVKNVLFQNEYERLEGGDVIQWDGHLFVGYSKEEDFEKYQVARTNEAGVGFLKRNFSNWEVRAFELNKSDEDSSENTLHLDCCFQPVGNDKAVICPEGFKSKEDVRFLINFFGEENVFIITKREMYEMNTNFFSIRPDVVISDSSFTRLNEQLRTWGIIVEEVKYQEVTKMGGLLRCTTMPLRRKYD